MNDEERYAAYLANETDTSREPALDTARRDELDVLRGLLGADEIWSDPPPELVDAVVTGIRDAGGVDAAEPPRSIATLKRRRAPWLLAAAAAVLVAVLVAGVIVRREGDDRETFALAATDVIPNASGSVEVEETGSGLALSLSVGDLPPAAPGTFYQAWMKGPGGSVPVGTFHAREGDGPIELWSGVDADDYPTMTVTIQREGAGPESSGIVVLSGEIADTS